MGIERMLCLVTVLLLVCCPVVRAESELPTRGTYDARFFWQASGKWFEVEKAHLFWIGEFNGTFFNATLVWKCTGIERWEGDAEFLGGTGTYTGLKGSNTVYGALRSAADPEGSSGYAVPPPRAAIYRGPMLDCKT